MKSTFSIDFPSLSEDELAALIYVAKQEQDRRTYLRIFEAEKDKVLTALKNFCNAIDEIPDHACDTYFDTYNFHGGLHNIKNFISELQLEEFE